MEAPARRQGLGGRMCRGPGQARGRDRALPAPRADLPGAAGCGLTFAPSDRGRPFLSQALESCLHSEKPGAVLYSDHGIQHPERLGASTRAGLRGISALITASGLPAQ